jgi:hypothetical protein
VSSRHEPPAAKRIHGFAYIAEFGRLREGSSHLNYAVYHDRYGRTPDGWKFADRLYEVKYVGTTPLAGSAPHATASPCRPALAPGIGLRAR